MKTEILPSENSVGRTFQSHWIKQHEWISHDEDKGKLSNQTNHFNPGEVASEPLITYPVAIVYSSDKEFLFFFYNNGSLLFSYFVKNELKKNI